MVTMSTEVQGVRKEELRVVLCKYGLEADLEVLWVMGFRDVDDIPWMTTGKTMQEGEFVVEEPEVENWYRHGDE